MSDGNTNDPPRFRIPKNKPMQIGDVSELLAEARAAGEKIGMQVPTTIVPPPVSDAPLAPAEPERPASRPAPPSKSTPGRAIPKERIRRREVRLQVNAALVARVQHHCIDAEMHFRDAVEQALDEFLKRRG